MKRIISKNSVTNEQKLNDILSQTTTDEDGCMIWQRCLNTDGYPNMYGNVKVHRFVYELFNGYNPKGYVIRHTCDNPKCINPNHLIKGTVYENVQDRVDRDRTFKVITKEIVAKTKALLDSRVLSQKEIAEIVGIDRRRVSDISRNLYNDDSKLIRR